MAHGVERMNLQIIEPTVRHSQLCDALKFSDTLDHCMPIVGSALMNDDGIRPSVHVFDILGGDIAVVDAELTGSSVHVASLITQVIIISESHHVKYFKSSANNQTVLIFINSSCGIPGRSY